MNLLLVTMIHTGTRFFVRLIYEATGVRPQTIAAEGPGFVASHIGPRKIAAIEAFIAKHHPLIVVTERDPVKHQTSCLMKLVDPRQVIEARTEYWKFRDKYNPLVISFDAPDRDEKLAKFSEALGVTLTTDWQRKPSDYSHVDMGGYNALPAAS